MFKMPELLQEKKPEQKKGDGCIFCRIISGEIPCAKIYEDDKALSFLDIAPANKGHCLILPKKHYETLLEFPEEELDDILKITKKIARAISSSLGNAGFNVLMNNGKAAGQLVPHAHIHIIPRFAGDGIRLNWKPRKYADKRIDELKERIVKFF